MRSDELYKFSDRTLTGLQTSLDDITKNFRMEYLPKRRWSTSEKRSNIMIKRSRDDKDKDEGPFARSYRGLKKRKTSKDAEPTTSPKTKDSLSRSSKGTKSQPKSFGKSVYAEEPKFEVGDTDTHHGPAFRLLKGTRSNYDELEYNFEECYKSLSEKLDWENPEGSDYPFDLFKPLPLITRGNRQT
nr:hypothetical protein [Tanacetum cinerariifolium]